MFVTYFDADGPVTAIITKPQKVADEADLYVFHANRPPTTETKCKRTNEPRRGFWMPVEQSKCLAQENQLKQQEGLSRREELMQELYEELRRANGPEIQHRGLTTDSLRL